MPSRSEYREHWFSAQRHIYRHGYHSTVSEFFGWTALAWKTGARGSGLLLPRLHPCPIERAVEFLAGMRTSIPIPQWQIETDPELDPEVEAALEGAGWTRSYDLPGHAIPLTEEFAAALMAPPADFEVRFVETEEQVLEFAHVQDEAYVAEYGTPRDLMAQFYADPASLLGPHTLAVLGYLKGEPVRAGALYDFEGIAGGMAGACLPDFRGRHYGEPLMAALVRRCIERGLTASHHVTMPPARAIAKRLGFEVVTIYTRWVAPPVQEA